MVTWNYQSNYILNASVSAKRNNSAPYFYSQRFGSRICIWRELSLGYNVAAKSVSVTVYVDDGVTSKTFGWYGFKIYLPRVMKKSIENTFFISSRWFLSWSDKITHFKKSIYIERVEFSERHSFLSGRNKNKNLFRRN